MYGRNDIRASLASAQGAGPKKPIITPFKSSSYGIWDKEPPQQTSPGVKSWMIRGQTLVTEYSLLEKGGVLSRANNVDEYAIIVPDAGTKLRVEWKDEVKEIDGPSFICIPAGASTVTCLEPGQVMRCISTQNKDMTALCPNEAHYATPDPNVAEWKAWPDPVGGWHIRAYDGAAPIVPGRFGRLYRCTTVMVNFGDMRNNGPRDRGNMSPYHHDDFEQYSVCWAGAFTHHLRYPWTSDGHSWLPDEHVLCPAPSVGVIPPPATHTSSAEAPVQNRLMDVFGPPRWDFSVKEGWVMNAADYPMPEEVAKMAEAVPA